MITAQQFLPQLNLSPSQNRAVVAREGDVAVTAGAGTGKTRTLVARYISLLDELPLRQIVAITFTDKAAREMRNRVREVLDRVLNQTEISEPERLRWQDRLAALDSARISTIHSLCSEILRTHPAEANLDPRFTVLDESNALLLKEQAITRTLSEVAHQKTMKPLFDRWGETGLNNILETFLSNPGKGQAALDCLPSQPTDILIFWQEQLELAQTECLNQLLKQAEWQKHLAVLRYERASRADDNLEGKRLQALVAIDHMGTTVAERRLGFHALKKIVASGGKPANWPGGEEQITTVREALKWLKSAWDEVAKLVNLTVNEQDAILAECLPLLRVLFVIAIRNYQAYKTEQQALDFDDLEIVTLHLLENKPAVRNYWQAQVSALLVDEFQDTNAHQLRLIRRLCPEPRKLFIVGDAKQSIYRFRGADVSVFQVERNRIEHAGGTVCDLDRSYRTHQGLLETMNHLLRPILGEPRPDRHPWEAPFAPLRHTHQDPKTGITSPFFEMHLGIGTKEKGALGQSARMVAHRFKQLAENKTLAYGDMVILCRASSSFAVYEDALDDAGIAYVTVAGRGFYQRPEIRSLLNALQAIDDPSDNLALVGLLGSPLCGLSDVALYELTQAQALIPWQALWATLRAGISFSRPQDIERSQRAINLIERWHSLAGRQTVAEVLQAMIAEAGYLAGLFQTGQHRAARNVEKLLITAHQSERIRIAEFLSYLTHLRESGSREGEARTMAEGVVQIMSVHQAKGLEFPLVVLGDAGYEARGGRDTILLDEKLGLLLKVQGEDDQKPALFALVEAQEKAIAAAEEKRLLYVAMTRSEQMVMVSGVVGLSKGGKPLLANWLKAIGQVSGFTDMNFADVNPDGEEVYELELQVGTSPIHLMLYEGQAQPTHISVGSPTHTEGLAPFVAPTLLEPLMIAAAPTHDEEHPKEVEQPQRVWQVVPTTKHPTAPAWVVGSLVHAALALWHFPDAVFDVWCLARANEYGLTNTTQLHDAVEKTRKLLERFRQHPLYEEMNSAERRLAEVPYMLTQNGQTDHGIIDVLYLRDGKWTVVDYKTDDISSEAVLAQVLDEKDYRDQLRRYAVAVERLVGTRPRLLLCFLQVGQHIWLEHLLQG